MEIQLFRLLVAFFPLEVECFVIEAGLGDEIEISSSACLWRNENPVDLVELPGDTMPKLWGSWLTLLYVLVTNNLLVL
jgi:hypothetical protein